jgi:hypothetical protein
LNLGFSLKPCVTAICKWEFEHTSDHKFQISCKWDFCSSTILNHGYYTPPHPTSKVDFSLENSQKLKLKILYGLFEKKTQKSQIQWKPKKLKPN